MDVADAAGEHVYAAVCDGFAFVGVCAFAHTDDAVFFAADSADFSFQGDAFVFADLSEFSGLFEVLVEGECGTIKHDGGVPGLDAGFGSLIVAVVKVKGDRDGDAHGVDEVVDHVDNEIVAAHVLGSTHRGLNNDRSIGFLRALQNGLSPFEVVDIESTNTVTTFTGSDYHVSSRNCHNILLMYRVAG